MLNKLSAHYQREIALSFMALFFTSGLSSLKAELYAVKNGVGSSGNASVYGKNYANTWFHNNVFAKDEVGTGFISDDNGKAKRRGNRLQSGLQNFSVKGAKAKFDQPYIGGPSQPEMSAFKPVGSDNMVSPFTGDFSYNIPLLDVGGYPINMFYSSGISMDQEASWLGLGWGINPGTITRNMRGLPDDFNGSDKIVKTQSFRDDKTFGITAGAGVRFAGFPLSNLGATIGLSWNNKLGIASEAGLNTGLTIGSLSTSKKTYNLSFNAGLNASSRGGASASPSIKLEQTQQSGALGTRTASIGVGYNYSSRMGLTAMHLDMNVSKNVKVDGDSYSQSLWNSTGTLSFAYPSVLPSITKPFTRQNYSLDFSAGAEAWGLFTHVKLHGYYSLMYLAEEDKRTVHPAYGVLNLQGAENDKDALLDFNRANDGVYTPNSPTIAMPVYTYDVFSINGEGTGGSFRAYRGDVGHMRDAYVKTKENAFGLGADLGFGNTLHVGADLNYVYTPTEAGDWVTNNMASSAFAFQNNSGTYQAAYFKNPGEKTVPDQGFQRAMANEDLVRLKLANTASANPMLLPKLMRYDGNKNWLGDKPVSADSTKKINRDRRTQVISFLTAEESERIGMNTKLYSYNAQGGNENHIIFSANCNKAGVDSFYRNQDVAHISNGQVIPGGGQYAFRHKHHISEIDVLGSDGRKYVYGLPVYNKKQYNVTFGIDPNQKKSDSKALYDEGDNTTSNTKGRDWYMEKEEIPAYTHSYLLTELTSPNYVDVTGNGITEDDMGDAVKFNYSNYEDYKWRTPVGGNTASYSSGLKTDEKDDKAHYVYGEREAWYLYSVESKNMVARFYVKSDRKDGRPVVDETGALDTDPSKGMKRLDKISLFSKGDLAKLGDGAKPIKTIRFFQSYKLCKNTPGVNDLGSNIEQGQGKLTLDSIWITYNGNDRKPKSRYVFYYPDNTNNPNYNFDQSDRWGSYKPATDNPGSGAVTNEEYPYSVQDQIKADKNVAAWTMNKILLPSGGVINVDYESDTYAYVQNRKAACMYQVIGFGTSETSLPLSAELNKLYTNDGVENDHVYVQLPTNITVTGADGKKEFAARYLEDIKQLYLKLSVTMPVGSGLSGIAGEETIPVYADIADYGLLSSNVAWIKIADVGTNHTILVQSVLQFLTRQLPGKAYKGYDLSETGGMKSVVMAMGGMLNSVGSMFTGEISQLKADLKCQQVVLAKTFTKLTNPVRNKFGGGLRVKRVTISDNWEKMTNQTKATYGQEYKYTTTELINGKLETISSGVASWEPSIGSEENPFREIMRFVDHNKGGPYDFGATEMPLGEMFYPSPMVGYSRVEVLSIHRDTVKNLPTRQVTEFYTNKDFPYKSIATDLTGDANAKYEPAKIMQLLKIDMMKGIAQSQGFLVETNDMNGKEKSHATYTATDPVNPVSYTQNFYNIKQATDKTYSFNHDFPVINGADGKVTAGVIGRDVELMTDFRQHHSETITANLSINFDGFFVGFFPIPLNNILQPVVREGLMYRSAAVLKVVTHYGMLDSVVVVDKGSMVSTKNLVYDAETGNPLLTRTQNEHNKPVYNFNYPAHWAYSGMGPAYKNIDAVYSGLNFGHGILVNAPTNAPGLLENVLESGDEIYVVAKNADSLQAVLPCDDPAGYTAANLPWATLKKTVDANGREINRIWAVNTSKSGSVNGQWVFMDARGYPYNAVNASIRIIRSGRRNMIDQSVAAIGSLNNPVVNNQLTFTDATNIIQTTAATFKDNWRVDNSFFQKDSVITLTAYSRVKVKHIYAQDYLNAGNHQWEKRNGSTLPQNVGPFYSTSKDNFLLSNRWGSQHNGRGGTRNEIAYSRSFLLFDYSSVPAYSNFYAAYLSLSSHTDNNKVLPFNLSANHPGLHSNAWSHPLGPVGYIHSLKGNWLPTSDANGWGDTYLNARSDLNVSSNQSAVQQIPMYTYDDFKFRTVNSGGGFIDTRVPMTSIVAESRVFTLGSNKKIGIRIKDEDDCWFGNRYDNNARCFWSPQALGIVPVSSPMLSYYYYVCGDTSRTSTGNNDPIVDRLVVCNSSQVVGSFCISKFGQKAINPYLEGVLGNWRVDSTYAYYGERKETDPTAAIDTRIGGTIKDYKTFWSFASTPVNPSIPIYLSRNQQAADVWVWNSTITQYNRKGYEIENTDPLGRYNAGLYGYNQQLPTAVANNSRVREVLFDGFEDYDYHTSSNCISCQPHRQFNYTTAIASQLDNTQKHTGRYSVRVNAGQSVKIQAPVTALPEANRSFGYKVIGSTISYTNQYLGMGGTPGSGLKASYFNHPYAYPSTPILEPGVNSTLAYINPATGIGPVTGSYTSNLVPGQQPQYFSIKWEGKIQAPATGTYYFKPVVLDRSYRIKINGTQLSTALQWENGYNHTEQSAGYSMVVGQTYTIEVCYYTWNGNHNFILQWKRPDQSSFTSIPVNYLYPPTATSFQQVITSQQTCNRLDSSKVTGNALTDTFSLLQGKKMLLSAWVKVGTANCCFPATYDNGSNSITISYDGSNTASVTMKPTGNIIEGWQRYEADFTIPANAIALTISLNNTGSTLPVYFDDIRVHPYNANVKSFVYHSSNLRLMAELDENNYASFYEYDDDGTLTRVKKETQRGVKTITETRSAMQKKIISE